MTNTIITCITAPFGLFILMFFIGLVIQTHVRIGNACFFKGESFISLVRKNYVTHRYNFHKLLIDSIDYYYAGCDWNVESNWQSDKLNYPCMVKFRMKNNFNEHLNVGWFVVHAHDHEGNVLFSCEPYKVYLDLKENKSKVYTIFIDKDSDFCKQVENNIKFNVSRLSVNLVSMEENIGSNNER